MSIQAGSVARSLGLLFAGGTHCGLADAELLDRFVSLRGDDAAHAFEGLVMRHGPMVLDVCRRVLGDPHDAQDAFQATFLVLATNARSIRRQRSVGSWLHGVALRVARRARSDAARRRLHEHRIAAMMTAREAATNATADDRDFAALHEEVGRLPRKYREAVVLCYLEGLSLEAAAGQLGCPVGTLGVRLMRARERLRTRLAGRGISGANGLLLAGPAAIPLPVALPGELVRSTVGAAMQAAGGIGGTVPTVAARLASGVSRRMTMLRLTPLIAGILVATGGMATLGVMAVGQSGPQAAGKAARQATGQDTGTWIGKKAVIRWSAPVMDGDRVVGDNVFRVFRVDRIDGDRVELAADGIVGWIQAEDVVLLDRAIEFYTEVIQGNEKHLAARLKRAQVREYLGDRARAIVELTEAIEIGPPNPVLYGIRSDMFIIDKHYDKAISDLTKSIEIEPLAVAYNNRAHCWSAKHDDDKAIADYTDAIRLDPEYGLSYLNRGLAWSRKEDRDKAIADYTEAIRLGVIDGRGVSLIASAYNMRGRAHQENEEPDAAVADLNEAIRLEPGDASAYHNRGLAWLNKHEYDKAIADFDEAIRLAPGPAYVYSNRGHAWFEKHEYEKAIADFDDAIRLEMKDADTYIERGRARGATQEHDKAIADFNEAIRLDPKLSDAYFYRGYFRLDREQDTEAIADFTEAIRLAAEVPESYYHRGRAWSAQEDFDKAIADFDRAIRLDPKNVAFYSRRGVAWFYKPDCDKAIADFDEAIRLDPKDMDDRFYRGWALAKKKQYEKAFAAFDEVVRLDPKNPDGHVARARLWATCLDAQCRDGKKAIESATRACELSEWKDGSHLNTLAAAYAEAGDFDSAVKWQTKANELNEDEETRQADESRLELYRARKPYHAELP